MLPGFIKMLAFAGLVIVIQTSLPSLGPVASAQIQLSSDDWRLDLRFLQKTIHDDYPFLLKKISSEKFDARVEELYRSIPDLEQHEVAAGMARIVALIGYGHTRMAVERSAIRFHQLPVNLYQFGDGIYVQGVHKDYQNTLGARVIAIEGVPVDKALQAIRTIVPVENEQFLKAYGLRYLCIPEVLHAQGVIDELKNEITFQMQLGDKTFDETFVAVSGMRIPTSYGFVKQTGNWLDARDQGDTPLYLKNLDKIYFLEYLPDSRTLYVRHSQIQDEPRESIPEFYDRVFEFVENNEVDRLVLDVRLNGGGNNYKIKPIVTGIIRCNKINQKGKLFVIIGRRTFSACQNLVNELDNYTQAIFVGEPTAENINFYGDTRRVDLPKSKIPVFLSFAWWQDKPQWENAPWLAPQIAIDISFDEFRSNQDPALDAAIRFSDGNFVVDPLAHLTKLFAAGKMEDLELEAKRLVEDSRYRFVDFEAKFNQAGYDLVSDNRASEALEIFKLNTRLYPDSANTWDSLAETLASAGQTEKAIKFYTKAMKLDPEGGTGDNARRMLEQLRKQVQPDQPDASSDENDKVMSTVATHSVARTRGIEEWGGLTIRQTGAAIETATHVAVFLHGFGGGIQDMASLSEYIKVPKGTCLVFPEAPIELERGGHAWWTRPAQYQSSRDKVLALLKYIRQQNTNAQLVLGGFSQGAILSSNFLEKDCELVTALILLSPVEKLRDNVTGKAKNKPAIFLSHGRSDKVLPFDGSKLLNERLVKLDYQVDWVPYDGGHNVPPVVILRLNEFVTKLLKE